MSKPSKWTYFGRATAEQREALNTAARSFAMESGIAIPGKEKLEDVGDNAYSWLYEVLNCSANEFNSPWAQKRSALRERWQEHVAQVIGFPDAETIRMGWIAKKSK
jgi:hypothetical protein